MENESKRKKSISLLLIIFILLLVAILVFLIVSIVKDNSEEEITGTTENSSTQISVTSNTTDDNTIENISEFNTITNSTSNTTENSIDNEISNTSTAENTTIDENTTSSEDTSLKLNNHSFKFTNTTDVSIIQDSGKSVIQAVYSDYNYKMLLNTDNSTSFDSLKNNSDLNTYIESNYNLSVNSSLKSGNLGGLDVIFFTISNGANTAYCVITPLNDSEVLYAQIYNTTDMTTLIDNNILAESLNEISNIIADSQD